MAGTYLWTDVYARLGVNPGLVPLLALGALLSAGYLDPPRAHGLGLRDDDASRSLFTVATLFMALFPRVMVSSLDPEWSLTIYNASSTPYTLQVMSIVAVIFVPIVLAYQALDVLGVPAPDHGGDEARVLIPLPGADLTRIVPSAGAGRCRAASPLPSLAGARRASRRRAGRAPEPRDRRGLPRAARRLRRSRRRCCGLGRGGAVARAAACGPRRCSPSASPATVRLAVRDRLLRRLLALGPRFASGERTGELANTLVGGVDALDAYLAQYLPAGGPRRRRARRSCSPPCLRATRSRPSCSSLTFPLVPLFMWLIGGAARGAHARGSG